MIDVGKFYGHLVCFIHIYFIQFMDIRTFCGHLGIIFPFWLIVPRKTWQPGSTSGQSRTKSFLFIFFRAQGSRNTCFLKGVWNSSIIVYFYLPLGTKKCRRKVWPIRRCPNRSLSESSFNFLSSDGAVPSSNLHLSFYVLMGQLPSMITVTMPCRSLYFWWGARGQFLTTWFAPRGEVCP
jgi:hypothetical protein